MENYSLVPNLSTAQNYLVFDNAPYYLGSLSLSITATAKSTSLVTIGVLTPLVLGVDYFPAFLFNSATGELKQSIYGGVSFVDPLLAGAVQATYSPLGNGYTVTSGQVQAIYTNPTLYPLSTLWEVATTAQPYAETTPLVNTQVQTKMTAVTAAVTTLAATLTNVPAKPSVFNYANHIADQNNPHLDTALSAGLGNVPNWSTGTASDITAGTSGVKFVTPAAVAATVNTVVPNATNTAIGKAALNIGTSLNDNINNVDALTAGGLVYLLQNGLLSAFQNVQNNQRTAVGFTPAPLVYPTRWGGVVCNCYADLVAAVQSSTGISPLTYSATRNLVYFPHTATVPSLALSPIGYHTVSGTVSEALSF